VLSVTVLISGLNSTKLLEASRHLALGRMTVIELIAQAVGVACTLVWVLFDRSIWALVAGNVSAASIAMLLSHGWMPGIANRVGWDRSAFDEIFRFGRWIFLSSILGFLVSNADRLFLGGITSANVLGVYVIAYSLVASVETVLSRIIGGVAFPALSEIARERPQELKRTYYRLHSTIAPFVYFCSGVLVVAGNVFIGILYDPRYEAAGWMLQILAVTLVVVPSQISLQCFMALGMPQLHSRVLGIRLIVLCVCMPAGAYFFDVPGALWGAVLSQLLCLPVTLTYAMRHGLFDLRRELLSLLGLPVGMMFGALFKLAVEVMF
jgi:O-antigen/teichoic acid export membrane protein